MEASVLMTEVLLNLRDLGYEAEGRDLGRRSWRTTCFSMFFEGI